MSDDNKTTWKDGFTFKTWAEKQATKKSVHIDTKKSDSGGQERIVASEKAEELKNSAFLRSNIVFVVFFICYTIIFYLLLRNHIEVFYWTVIIGLISMIFALSPAGEWLFRLMCGARRIKISQEIDLLMPIFKTVYSDAFSKYPKLSQNIELFIEDSADINTYALGSNTIVITRGTFETIDDEGIGAMLAHEFGHIYNGDTKILVFLTLGGGVVSLFFFLLNFVLLFTKNLFKGMIKQYDNDMKENWKNKNNEDFKSNSDGVGCAFASVFMIIQFILEKILILGIYGVRAVLAIGGRKNEFIADEFAFDIGYGSRLTTTLYTLHNMNINSKLSLKEKLLSDHPHFTDRIARLEKLLDDDSRARLEDIRFYVEEIQKYRELERTMEDEQGEVTEAETTQE